MTRETHWAVNVLAGAVTVCDGKFLLLKRSDVESFLPAVWGIPAGQMQELEDPGDTCMRELLEETGLRGELGELIGYSTFPSRRGSLRMTNVQLNFLVYVADCTVALNPASHSAHKWLSLDEADNGLLDSFTRDIVKAAFRYLPTNKPGARRWASLRGAEAEGKT